MCIPLYHTIPRGDELIAVSKTQTLRLSEDASDVARAYLDGDVPSNGPLFRQSRKDGSLVGAGMTRRSLTRRVRLLGTHLGLPKLSAHDCWHYWATQAARGGTPVDRLQAVGGWSSPAMPLRYVEGAEIANEEVVLR